MHHNPNLYNLQLSEIGKLTESWLPLMYPLKNLTTLDLSRAGVIHGSVLNDDAIVALIEQVGENLADLVLDDNNQLTDRVLVEGVKVHCPRLRRLGLEGMHLIQSAGVEDLFTDWVNTGMTHLNLKRCLQVEDDALDKMIEHSGHSLRVLDVHSVDELGDEALKRLANGAPKLEWLDLSFVRAADDFVVKEFLDRAEGLKFLFVHGANRVTNGCPHKVSQVVGGMCAIVTQGLTLTLWSLAAWGVDPGAGELDPAGHATQVLRRFGLEGQCACCHVTRAVQLFVPAVFASPPLSLPSAPSERRAESSAAAGLRLRPSSFLSFGSPLRLDEQDDDESKCLSKLEELYLPGRDSWEEDVMAPRPAGWLGHMEAHAQARGAKVKFDQASAGSNDRVTSRYDHASTRFCPIDLHFSGCCKRERSWSDESERAGKCDCMRSAGGGRVADGRVIGTDGAVSAAGNSDHPHTHLYPTLVSHSIIQS